MPIASTDKGRLWAGDERAKGAHDNLSPTRLARDDQSADDPAREGHALFSAWPSSRGGLLGVILVAGGISAGLLPLLIKFAIDLWSRPQYQFAPLLLAGVPFVAWGALRDLPPTVLCNGGRRARTGIIVALLALALAALLAGAVLYVRWFAPLAALLAGTAGVYAVGEGRVCRALCPAGILLAMLIPLPGRWDEAVLVSLRRLAVGAATPLLDGVGVPVLASGSVLQIPGHRLMVEEACSGINSLLAVLAFTVLVSFWKRLPAWSLLLLLPAAFGLVFWANVLRIVTCAAARYWWDIDLLSGTVHEALGLLLFAGCMGLVFSAERLIDRWLKWGEAAAGPDPEPDLDPEPEPDPARDARLTAPHSTPPGDAHPRDAHPRDSHPRDPERNPQPRDYQSPALQRQRARSMAGESSVARLTARSASVWAAATLLFLATGVFSYVRVAGAWPASVLPGAQGLSMPRVLAGWTRVDAPAGLAPEPAEVSGRQSRLWQYRRGGQTATIGVDYPFPGYHDATTCYRLAGWDVSSTRELPPGPGGISPFEVTMRKAPVSIGTLRFALCDEAGRWLQRPAPVAAGENRLAGMFRLSREKALSTPLVQLQVLRVDFDPISEHQRAELADLFFEAGVALRGQIAAAGELRR